MKRGKQILKRRPKLGQWVGVLKRGQLEPLMNYVETNDPFPTEQNGSRRESYGSKDQLLIN